MIFKKQELVTIGIVADILNFLFLKARRARVALLYHSFQIENLRYNPYSNQLLFFENWR